MNDEEKNMYSDEDLRLLQVLGEAAGEQPSAEETEKAWQQFRQQHRQRQNNRYIWASVAAACAGVTPNAPHSAMAHSASDALNAPGDMTSTWVLCPAWRQTKSMPSAVLLRYCASITPR